jgi:membrane fusion protein, multidrug efflux system
MSSSTARVILSACLTAALAACSSSNAADPDGGAGGGRGRGRAGGGGTVPVVTAKVLKKAVPLTIPAVGNVEAATTVQIRAQVTGQLSAVQFAEGQDVRKGQPLFSIDARPFQTALQQAEAVLARDTATAKNLAAQQARADDLYKRGLIPRDQYETTIANATSSQATLEADRAAVETARLNLQYTNILAPVAGRTGTLGVHMGDLVRANDTTPMIVINQLSPIYVTFSVPGRYLPDIRRYQARKRLKLYARGQPSLPPGAPPQTPSSTAPDLATAGGEPSTPPEEGVVTFIDNAIDPMTGTIKLKGTFQNADHALWPGLFVQVTLQLAADPDAIVVPAAAVQASQSGQYVYVIKPDRTAELRPVTVERQQGDDMVIAQGLTAGEEVVTDGQLRLTPGARVSTGRGEGEGRGADGGRRGKRGVQP